MTIQIPGAPTHELLRSTAAQRIGILAEQSGLRLSHFESRLDLEWPEDWEPQNRPDLGQPQHWKGGVLPETKYRSFAHDRVIGSFHPSHRAKWTAHELCHGLVGFAWAPNFTRFHHALAARVSEVLPVALYYFFDEADLRRCPNHAGHGPLFGAFCSACEQAAAQGPINDLSRQHWMEQGRAFVERELHAVKRSLRDGRMVPNHYHSIELSSDGLGYAAAHSSRLKSPEFHQYIDLFFRDGQAWFSSLDALINRVESLTEDLCGGASASPWSENSWHWMAQDIGWRMLQVLADCGGSLRNDLNQVIASLAANTNEQGIEQAIVDYNRLSEEWVMPNAQEVFSTGYDLPLGHGHSTVQVQAGIQSALPMTTQLMDSDFPTFVQDFVAQDAPTRVPLGHRFCSGLDPNTAIGALADLEAALSHAPAADLEAATLRGLGSPPFRLRQGLSLLTSNYSIDVALDPEWRMNPTPPLPRENPLHMVVFREPDGEVQVLEVSDTAMAALRQLEQGLTASFSVDDQQELSSWGIIMPSVFKTDL